MIVVTTPTGSIGSQLVEQLLAANEKVRVVARHPEKLAAEVRERVDVVQGSSDDESVLDRALDGRREPVSRRAALLPGAERDRVLPTVHTACLRGDEAQRRLARRHGLRHRPTRRCEGRRRDLVVRKDVEFERAGFHVRALWCPGFMENMLREVESIRTPVSSLVPRRPDVQAPLGRHARHRRDRRTTAPRSVVDGRRWPRRPWPRGSLSRRHRGDHRRSARSPGPVQQVPVQTYKAQLLNTAPAKTSPRASSTCTRPRTGASIAPSREPRRRPRRLRIEHGAGGAQAGVYRCCWVARGMVNPSTETGEAQVVSTHDQLDQVLGGGAGELAHAEVGDDEQRDSGQVGEERLPIAPGSSADSRGRRPARLVGRTATRGRATSRAAPQSVPGPGNQGSARSSKNRPDSHHQSGGAGQRGDRCPSDGSQALREHHRDMEEMLLALGAVVQGSHE